MGMGVIFMVDETVANVFRDLRGDCLMRRAVEASKVDVKNVRGCRKRRGSMHGYEPMIPRLCAKSLHQGEADLRNQRLSPTSTD